jgi:acyl-CoA thioesterase-1
MFDFPAMPMTRFRTLPVLLALALSSLPSRGGETPRIRFIDALVEGHKQKIVVYGTSLTANSEWPSLLKERLSEDFGKKAQITNAALGGMDSRWGLANVRKRVVAEAPDAVFIEFAVNDALASSKLSTAEARWDLEQMIGAIQSARPACQVILMVMNPPTGKPLEERRDYRKYEQVYRQVAQELSCPLIDFSGRWKSIIARQPERWRDYAPDGLHPNRQAAADVIMPMMLKQFGLADKQPASDFKKS